MKEEKKSGLFNFIQTIEGDKVIWIIMLLLILASFVTISSSTSLLALTTKTTRIAIIREQLFYAGIGMAAAYLIYKFFKISWTKNMSKYAFFIALIPLIFLITGLNLGFIKGTTINNSKRIIYFFSFQLNVNEIAKIAMVMYTAWAISAFKSNNIPIVDNLRKFAQKHNLGVAERFLKTPLAAKIIYMWIPIFTVCGLCIGGSMFSALFIGAICFFMLLITGCLNIKDIFLLIATTVFGIMIVVSSHYNSKGDSFGHVGSAMNRIGRNYEKELIEAQGTDNFQKVLDKNRQPISAKIAIKEGGIFGKGPGRSTQRYVVPIMYEDYMFAFIVEEYGIMGAILILIAYCSLLARGAILIKYLKDEFTRDAMAGLVILISGQAIIHILINVGIFPLSGLTLPLISHGNFSLLVFSIAFGTILLYSKEAKNTSMKEDGQMINKDVKDYNDDEIKSQISELDKL